MFVCVCLWLSFARVTKCYISGFTCGSFLRNDSLALCKIPCFPIPMFFFLFVFSVSECEQQQEQDPTNLYISNLPLSVDEKELENMLQPLGQVVSTRILRDYSGNSRGVGFARSVSER